MELGPHRVRGRGRGPQLGLPLGREGLLERPLRGELRGPASFQRAGDASSRRLLGRAQGAHKGSLQFLFYFTS